MTTNAKMITIAAIAYISTADASVAALSTRTAVSW